MSSSSVQQVPDDVVLFHIFCRLDNTTRVRCAAVCRSWRALSRKAPPLMPCLYIVDWKDAASTPLPSAGPCDGIWKTYTKKKKKKNRVPYLFDPISATTRRLPLPEMKLSWEIAGCHGPYLAYSPLPCISFISLLFNPLTGETLHRLPLAARYPDGQKTSMRRFVGGHLATTPSPGSPTIVALVDNLLRAICIWRRGPDEEDDDDQEWVMLPQLGKRIHDIIFYRGELYCIYGKARILAYDLQSRLRPTPRTVYTNAEHEAADPFPYYVTYSFVESCGELLVVTWYQLYDPSKFRATNKSRFAFYVHRLEGGKLVKVEDMGDTMLLVGRGFSMSWRPTSEPNEFFRKSCIYFVDFHESCYRLGRWFVGRRPGSISRVEFIPDPLPATSYPFWFSPHSSPSTPFSATTSS